MRMKIVQVCFLLSALVACAYSAICVEMCGSHDDLDLPPCPPGFVCRSNGCGHTCQPVLVVQKRQRCPMLKCIPCPNGYELDEHGCQTCKCLPAKRAVCSMVMCAMYCINGFQVDSDGCQICRCA
ncbi:hypothetical protein Btru_058277 [Bulinus truncatus]|nr:hypothetical protein Btru_058277 [Bulinus truncatus]